MKRPSTIVGIVACLTLSVVACGDSDITVNTTTVKASDGSFQTIANLPIAIGLATFSSAGAKPAITIVTQPTHGTLGTPDASGVVTFTPAANYVGSDSFTFKASDGGAESSVATITIAVIEAPAAIAQAQSVMTNEDTPVEITLGATNKTGGPVTFAVAGPPAHGTVGSVADGKVTYTPDANYSGSDTLTFTATSDGKLLTAAQVAITVQPVNDLPVAGAETLTGYVGAPTTIVLSATDAEGNAVTYAVGNASNGTLGAVTGNKVTFTPTAAGAASFTFTATDGTGTGAPATVTVNALASAKSCLEMRRAGVVASGVYKVDADGDGDEPTLDVYCDQVYDGGGWLRLVNHDIAAGGYFPSKVAAESSNEGDPTSPLHSILGHLEGFRTNGGFEFRLGWPAKHALRNIWMQTSNPLAGSVEGYRGVRTDTRSVYWGGLEKSQSALTLLDGSVFVTDFWYAVGEISAYGKGLPAAPGVSDDGSVRAVQLWVRPVPTCGDGFVDDLETCDDGNMKDGDGCNASCQVEATAFHSCREILAGGQSKGDGTYIIKPTDSSADTLAVYCDMTRDGGGWTMIGKASAGNYTHLTQDEYVALIMNANDHVTPTTLLDPTYPPYRTMAFLNRPTTNALGASSGHTVRIDYESETVPGATGIFFQKRLNVPNDWDLWGAIRDARLWNNDGTVTGDHVANFGTDFITGYSYDPVTEAVSNIGGGVLGCWPTSPGLTTYALNDGTNFEPCRHGGLIGDGFHSGNAWLFTANASDGRFRNDNSSRQRSRIWLR